MQDNLAQPIDRLLAFANGLLNGSTTEAIQVASVTATGAVSAASVAATAAITGASVTVTGAVTGATGVFSGAVTAASVAATAAVTGATVTATGAVSGASVAATGAVTGATVAATSTVTGATVTGSTSVVSGVGFKSVLGPAHYYATAYTPAGSNVRLAFPLFDASTSTVNQVEARQVMPFAGSIVGLGVLYFGSAVGTPSITLILGVNGSIVQTETNILVSPATFATTFKTYAKGSLAFTAGQYLTVNATFSATGNRGITAYLVVEMTA